MVESGIYTITNRENGKVYIGSTVSFEVRWDNHRNELQRGTHSNPHLQSSWNKHGENAFEFSILEYLDDFEELTKAEQFWMDIYREEGKELYNFGLAADNPMRGRKHTEETRQKMSDAARDRPNGMLGKRHTEETRRKISEVHKGNQYALGHKHSEESRHKMKEAWKNRSPVSEEHRHRIGEALIGNQNGLGYKHTEEAKRKMSVARKGRPAWNKGQKTSEETKRKMSESHKARWARVSYVLDCT